MAGWFWTAMFIAGAAGGTVWAVWGWPRMRDRYYRGKGVPDQELLP